MSNTINTLKTAKVGDKVTMLTFTGMNLGQFEVAKAGKTKIAIIKKDGTQAEFSRETGLQTNATNAKYANKVVDPIPEPEKKAPAKVEKTTEKAAEERLWRRRHPRLRSPQRRWRRLKLRMMPMISPMKTLMMTLRSLMRSDPHPTVCRAARAEVNITPAFVNALATANGGKSVLNDERR